MFLLILLFFTLTLFGYYFYLFKKNHYHFDKNGLKYIPGVPIFGNIYNSTFSKAHFIEDIDAAYKAFPNERYVGYVEGTRPIIVVRDPELMKLITIKDFDHFLNRKSFFPEIVDPLLGRSLISMRGEAWRHMRVRLSPAFTGSKMRHIFTYTVEIAKNIVDYYKDREPEDIDVIDLMQRYTNDANASAFFGFSVNSLTDKNNDFFMKAKTAVDFTLWQRIYYFIAMNSNVMGKIMQAFGIQLFPPNTLDFFRKIVFDTINYREENKIVRQDFIHLLMEALKGNLKAETDLDKWNQNEAKTLGSKINKEWCTDDITGQVFFAFMANFETTSSILTMVVHELAVHPDIQEKLYQAIINHEEDKGELNYENIGELKYLECVLNETFRKWSPGLTMDRICTTPYDLPPPREGGKPYRVKPGVLIYNVLNSAHMDPQYHPDPDVFDPERFSEENKHKIKSFTFMPFGMGPRNCLGLRFAMMELKVITYYLVKHFKILKCKKTADPIRLMPLELNIRAVGGTWVRFQSRDKKSN